MNFLPSQRQAGQARPPCSGQVESGPSNPDPRDWLVLRSHLSKRYIENIVAKKCHESYLETGLAGFSRRWKDEDMTVGYARLSEAGEDPAGQIQALRERGCEKIFIDRCQGRMRGHPQLDAALDSLRTNDTLVVWGFDQLARSLRHLIALARELERRQCRFVSLTESIDTGSPNGGTVFAVFAAMARFEADLRRERTADARRVARATGRRLGRPSRFHDSANVRAAQALLADPTVPAAEVARRFEVSRNTLYRWFPGGAPEAFTGRLEGGAA